MTVLSICAYPWDLIGDPTAGQRLTETGVDRVAIAAAYHSVRAATPLHPEHRLIDADVAALYVPVRPNVWAGRRLVPQAAMPWKTGARQAEADPFGLAAKTALKAGLEVDAWTVLLHSSVLGAANPDLCVRNAFGDVYTYALCPGNDEVIEYAATVVAEVAKHSGRSGATRLMVEACGPLGVSHLGHHDKTIGAEWSPVDEALLSLCLCVGCTTGLNLAGIDARLLAGVIRDSVSQGATTVDDSLGSFADTVRRFREETTAKLAARVVSAARAAGINRLAFHAQPDPWTVGPFVSLAATQPGGGLPGVTSGATYILPGAMALRMPQEEISKLAAETGARALGAYVNALTPQNSETLADDWRQLQDRGFDELCIYHFGLLSRNRLNSLGDAVAAIQPPSSKAAVRT